MFAFLAMSAFGHLHTKHETFDQRTEAQLDYLAGRLDWFITESLWKHDWTVQNINAISAERKAYETAKGGS